MTKDLARQLIKVQDFLDIDEAWENYFFKLKQEILQIPFASQLIKIKLKKINQASQIESVLFGKLEEIPPEIPHDQGLFDFSEILKKQSEIKLAVHQSRNSLMLLNSLMSYELVATKYEHYIYRRLKHLDQKDGIIPLKNTADIMEIVKELKELDKREVEEKKNLGKFEEEFPNLWQEFQRVRKGINEELIA